jgi:hypothetical protein
MAGAGDDRALGHDFTVALLAAELGVDPVFHYFFALTCSVGLLWGPL